jgi:hypothetical protein
MLDETGASQRLGGGDMRGRMLVWMAAGALLMLAGTAGAFEGEPLDREGLRKQAAENKALRRYLKHNGAPDVAELKPIMDQPPWDNHEVTLYYLAARKEISFARARVLGKPEVHLARYERTLTDADIRVLKERTGRLAVAVTDGTVAASPCAGSAVERAECAAGRAEQAADRVDVAAERAEKAADRTEAVVERMASRAAGRRR